MRETMAPDARRISSGTWEGHTIRTARKPGRCQYWLGAAGLCPNRIEAGDQYFDGEMDDFKAGGYARQRFCMAHSSDGAR